MNENECCPSQCPSDFIMIKDLSKSLKKRVDGLKLKCPNDCEVSLTEYSTHIQKCEAEVKRC